MLDIGFDGCTSSNNQKIKYSFKTFPHSEFENRAAENVFFCVLVLNFNFKLKETKSVGNNWNGFGRGNSVSLG